MASQSPVPRKRPSTSASQLATAIELPFVLVMGVVIGGGLGYLLDRWLHTSPAMTLILGILGFAGGFWDILKRLTRDEKKQEKGNGGPDSNG